MSSPNNSSPSIPSPQAPVRDPKRERKQLAMVFGGCAFTLVSAAITRRAVIRRMTWAKPTYFRRNDMHPEQKIDAGLEALEALSVATVNVFSWSILFAGGMMWATDTYGIEEARSRLRVRLGLKESEQKGSQAIVGQWIDAVKFWKKKTPVVEQGEAKIAEEPKVEVLPVKSEAPKTEEPAKKSWFGWR